MTTATRNGTVDTTDDRPEVELKPNGTVVCRIDGHPIRLRRPFLGELRAIRGALDDLNDESRSIFQTAKNKGLALDAARVAENLEGDELAARALQDQAAGRAISREMAVAIDELRIGWWRQVFDTLAMNHREFENNSALPPDDDMLPAWFVDPEAMGQIIEHFRTVPFGSGAVAGP